MNAKLIIAFIAVFIVGLYFGALSIKLKEYSRGGLHSTQARELLDTINHYKKAHGEYPDQQWFADLGEKRITVEDRLWVYHNPPLTTVGDSQILIAAPIDYGRLYMCGYVDGTVMSRSAGQLKK